MEGLIEGKKGRGRSRDVTEGEMGVRCKSRVRKGSEGSEWEGKAGGEEGAR